MAHHPTIHVRGCRLSDANELVDIDIKCFDDAWPVEVWNKVGHDAEYAISVATMFGNLIGFGVFRYDEDTHDVSIIKLAVKPYYRRKGASLHLLAGAIDYAKQKHAKALTIIVPESAIYPVGDQPSMIGGWVQAVGFKATKPFLRRHFESYGHYEDGVKFTASLRHENVNSANAA
jgi:ribosomal protein S18 acetylase RimI-like enzyme